MRIVGFETKILLKVFEGFPVSIRAVENLRVEVVKNNAGVGCAVDRLKLGEGLEIQTQGNAPPDNRCGVLGKPNAK